MVKRIPGYLKGRSLIDNLPVLAACMLAFLFSFGILPLSYALFIAAGVIVIYLVFSKLNPFRELHGYGLLIVGCIFSFFVIQALGLLYSNNVENGLAGLRVKLPFLILPVLILIMIKKLPETFPVILLSFISGIVLASIISYIIALGHSFRIFEGALQFNTHPQGVPWENYFRYSNFSVFLHPSYFGMYINFSIAILILNASGIINIPLVNKALSIFLIVFLTLTLFLLSSRAGLFTWFAVLMVYLLFTIPRDYFVFKKIVYFFPVLLIVGLLIFGQFNNRRFQSIQEEIQTLNEDDVEIKRSAAVRIAIWGESLQIIRKHWLIGVGTGDIKDVFYKEANSKRFNFARQQQYNIHNQFLETWLENGIIGLLLLLAIIFYPFFSRKVCNRQLLIYLSVIIFINFFFESMLNRINGVAFFVFFYSLLSLVPPEAKKEIEIYPL